MTKPNGSSRDHYRALADADVQIEPPLYYFDGLYVIVVDGFHGTAAWIAHHARGLDYAIEANMLTKPPMTRQVAEHA